MISRLLEPLAAALPAAGPGFMPQRASSVAGEVDRVFGFIFWVSLVALALILVLTVAFVVRYRRRPGRSEPEPSPAHHTRLELVWSGIPLALVMVMFGVSTAAWLGMIEPDAGKDPLRIQVTGRRWSWWFDHPSGKGAPELHLVLGRPTVLTLASTDVIHSLYLPDFRLKQDAVPGRFTRMTFTPVMPGTFPILCAEYCGTNHSRMFASAVVHPDQASFDAWARAGTGEGLALADLGKQVVGARGCLACHSLDGTPRVGPSFKGLWGRTERFADGTSAKVDEDYLRESVLKPGAKVVAGFPNVMPPVPLEERELQGIVAFLQTLGTTP